RMGDGEAHGRPTPHRLADNVGPLHPELAHERRQVGRRRLWGGGPVVVGRAAEAALVPGHDPEGRAEVGDLVVPDGVVAARAVAQDQPRRPVGAGDLVVDPLAGVLQPAGGAGHLHFRTDLTNRPIRGASSDRRVCYRSQNPVCKGSKLAPARGASVTCAAWIWRSRPTAWSSATAVVSWRS